MYFPLPLPVPSQPHQQLSVPPENSWASEVPSESLDLRRLFALPELAHITQARGRPEAARHPVSFLVPPLGWGEGHECPRVLSLSHAATPHTEMMRDLFFTSCACQHVQDHKKIGVKAKAYVCQPSAGMMPPLRNLVPHFW